MSQMPGLNTAQAAALQHVEDYARTLETIGQKELPNVLAMSNISSEAYRQAELQINQHARVGLHFHPDRLCRDGRIVADALLEDGIYKNQFETHLSSGKLDPLAGGARAGWEDLIFGGAYSHSAAELSDRPKYGALHLMLHPDGPCPRFGSCYFLLKPEVSRRCTFTYMDSHRNPIEKGTYAVFAPIMAALMLECFERRFTLGRQNISPTELVEHLTTRLGMTYLDPARLPAARNLNHYVEAQVHGEISLKADADVLVADPSFKATRVEDAFRKLGHQYGVELLWHCGFRLSPDEVPSDFRGPSMPSLARRIAIGNYIDASTIGTAAADLPRNPSAWKDRGSHEVVLQELKCLWHVLMQFGRPL